MADSAYESVLLVKSEVFVYKIPPRPSNRGYRAAEWKLDAPDWTGRLRVVSINKDLFIKLENKDGELFAQCPVECYPSVAVEPVMDSSRYFVIRIKDESGRSAFIGIGFADRSDSFDLNVSLQDHFKWLKQEKDAEKATQELLQGPSLDLGFKAGQTIHLNIGTKRSDAPPSKSRPKPRAMGGPLLPPPPASSGGGPMKIPPPSGGGLIPPPSTGPGFVPAPPAPSSSSSNPPAPTAAGGGSSNVDLLLDLGGGSDWSSSAPAPPLAPVTSLDQSGGDVWGDFTSASSGSNSSTQAASANSGGTNWVQF
ncbi:adaptin ear-binding coat-associated protein 1-like [Babylonia areolata]|uniref:adaptin ear-binding coat-associated protein 1-like n=1 Tax=Babylonia areolata TaxID=304850 RepID=UPI003FCF3C97